MENLEQTLTDYALYVLLFGSIFLVILAWISLKKKKLSESVKKTLFFGIVISATIPTLVMAGTTVYINVISSSKGPVHWHADFEIYACGNEITLVDPEGLSNKIGTPVLHEHNDQRVHLEGVVVEPQDASLGHFFDVVGGSLTKTSFSLPTNDGLVSYKNGDMCASGPGELSVFVYQTDDEGYYHQEKLEQPATYIMSPYANVPPGDCIIIEFGESKERTDKLCRSYQVAEKIDKLKGEK